MGHGHDEQPQPFSSACRAAADQGQDFNAQEVAITLWAMAKTSGVRPEVFDSLCRAAAAKVQDFNMQEFADTPCAIDLANTLGPWPQ